MGHVDQRLKGKAVLITGASGGLGEQVAYEAARRGAVVIGAAGRDRLNEVRERCTELSGGPPMLICLMSGIVGKYPGAAEIMNSGAH